MMILHKISALLGLVAFYGFAPASAQTTSNYVTRTNSPVQFPAMGVNGGSATAFTFTPKGSPLAGSLAVVLLEIELDKAQVQNFGNSTECNSTAVAPNVGGNICAYTYAEAQAKSGGLWARNSVLQLDANWNHSTFSSFGDEIDINNLAGDNKEFTVGNTVGILLNGLKYMNTAGISIQTGNSVNGLTGTNGTLPIWYYGIHTGVNAVQEADFDSQSNAVYGWHDRGKHIFGATYNMADTSQAAILLGDRGAAQGIKGAHVNSYLSMMYLDSDGLMHIGDSAAGLWITNGNIFPATSNKYELGSKTLQWSNFWTKNVNTTDITTSHAAISDINGIPTIRAATPKIGSSCPPGEQLFDARKLYMCLADRKWHTMAAATD
ncbi:hypothetical protein [Komagataeibacter sp. FXV3]|uniref:hypothetical protein n=1 Tax=Komagataeibacter sp. FXV3 TaxID=2608998 RepID=UPI00187B3CA5|nr:hypothetical protein [Komagataeibacter sp. FXV3]MBE7731374.1 hypothetical protein [Komagataeibacter sp. FXV3]